MDDDGHHRRLDPHDLCDHMADDLHAAAAQPSVATRTAIALSPPSVAIAAIATAAAAGWVSTVIHDSKVRVWAGLCFPCVLFQIVRCASERGDIPDRGDRRSVETSCRVDMQSGKCVVGSA